jgi:gamma-glutamylcyclotransferase (GGCT)/AIG2-like uncharacterized protein YtfP
MNVKARPSGPFLLYNPRMADPVTPFVFFYGTLMAGFDRRRRLGVDANLTFMGRGWIAAALFDLGIYPAAVPAADGRVWGELYEMREAERVLAALDEVEGYRPSDHDRSLYTRADVPVTLAGGRVERAWAYFYNAPLGAAQRIVSGDYLLHLQAR